MNDFQNAHETGKLIRYREQAERSREIEAVIKAGRFALVAVLPAYCPFTDATTGAASHLIAGFDTREQAEAEAATHYKEYPAEVDYFVLPKLPKTTRANNLEDAPF